MRRILVTGAAGFLGRASLPHLLAAGFDVWATTHSSHLPEPSAVHWRTADLLADGSAGPLLDWAQPTHLLHLAWYVAPGRFWTAEENRDWLAASLTLIRAAAAAGVRHAVVAGTCAEYDWSGGHCDEASTPLAPSTLYARCKADLHEAIQDLPGLAVAWARVFWQYGPHEHPERLAPSIIRALLEGREAVCRTPALMRPFLHVDDVGAGLAALCASGQAGAVNIVADEPSPIGEIVRIAAAAVGRPDLVRLENAATSEPIRISGSNARLRSAGWRPRRDLASGIADAVAWWKQAMELQP